LFGEQLKTKTRLKANNRIATTPQQHQHQQELLKWDTPLECPLFLSSKWGALPVHWGHSNGVSPISLR
jgi:hypothetical protein